MMILAKKKGEGSNGRGFARKLALEIRQLAPKVEDHRAEK